MPMKVKKKNEKDLHRPQMDGFSKAEVSCFDVMYRPDMSDIIFLASKFFFDF